METVIRTLGGCGRYQVLIALTVHGMKLVPCFSLMMMVFGAAVPPWRCEEFDEDSDISIFQDTNATTDVVGNASGPYLTNSTAQSCVSDTGAACRRFNFSGGMRTTVSEWNLVCDMAWVPTTIMSIQMSGLFCGHLVSGHIADMFGRKVTLFSSMVILILSNAVGAFSVSWVMFAVTRFFSGVGIAFHFTVQYSLMSEFTLAKWRPVIVAAPSWPLETAVFALAAWLIQDWQYIQVANAVLGVLFLPTWWFVPESFRWYVANNRLSEAEKVIQYVGRLNQRPVSGATAFVRREHSDWEVSRKRHKYTVIDLLTSRHLLLTFFLLFIAWLTLGLVTYAIQFGVQKWSGNLYINIFLFGVVCIPTQLLTIPLSNRIGRKRTSILCMCVCGLGALVVGVCQRIQMADDLRGKLTNGFALVATLGIQTLWPHVQTLTIEMYPTVLRNIGYGLLNMVARVGAVIGPQLVFLDSRVEGVSYFVCAGLCFLSVLSTVPLRETKDSDLQDTLAPARARRQKGEKGGRGDVVEAEELDSTTVLGSANQNLSMTTVES